MIASCCWFYSCCHPLFSNLIKLTKTEYEIVVVMVTIFTICDKNYMEKLPRGLKDFFFFVITNKSFSIFFHNFQTVLFKIYETLRNLPLPPSTILRMYILMHYQWKKWLWKCLLENAKNEGKHLAVAH